MECEMCKTVFNHPSAHCVSIVNPAVQLTFTVGELFPFSPCHTSRSHFVPILIISEIQHLYDALVVQILQCRAGNSHH